MGSDSKLYNLSTNDKINCDRQYNLVNDYSDKCGLHNKLLIEGISKLELIELCDNLIVLSMLSTEMLQEIRANLHEQKGSDNFILIDENDKRY